MIEYFIGDWSNGKITRGAPLPVVKGSDKGYIDINAESSLELDVIKPALTTSEQNAWRKLFDEINTMIVAADGDTVLWAGFIRKAALDHATQHINIQAAGPFEYLQHRAVYEADTDLLDDSEAGYTFTGTSWRNVIFKVINRAFENPPGTPDGLTVPQIIGNTETPGAGEVKFKVFYTDQMMYADVLEDIREENSKSGNEFAFIPRWSSGSQDKVVFDVKVGSSTNPKFNVDDTRTIRLEENDWKLSAYESQKDADELYSRLLLKSKESDKTAKKKSEWTYADMNSVYIPNKGLKILVDNPVSFPVELSSSEMSDQKSSYVKYADDSGFEVSLSAQGKSVKSLVSSLGETWTLTGVSNSLSSGDSAKVRFCALTFSASTDVVEVDLQSLKPSYPRLPKRRLVNDAKDRKKKRKKKNQRETRKKRARDNEEKLPITLPNPEFPYATGTDTIGVNSGYDGTDAIFQGGQWTASFVSKIPVSEVFKGDMGENIVRTLSNPDGNGRPGIDYRYASISSGGNNTVWTSFMPYSEKNYRPNDRMKFPSIDSLSDDPDFPDVNRIVEAEENGNDPEQYLPYRKTENNRILTCGTGILWQGTLNNYRRVYQEALTPEVQLMMIHKAWEQISVPNPVYETENLVRVPGSVEKAYDVVRNQSGDIPWEMFYEADRQWFIRRYSLATRHSQVVDDYMYLNVQLDVVFDYEKTQNGVTDPRPAEGFNQWNDGATRSIGYQLPGGEFREIVAEQDQPKYSRVRFTLRSKVNRETETLEGFGFEGGNLNFEIYDPHSVFFEDWNTRRDSDGEKERLWQDTMYSYRVGKHILVQERMSHGIKSQYRGENLEQHREWSWPVRSGSAPYAIPDINSPDYDPEEIFIAGEADGGLALYCEEKETQSEGDGEKSLNKYMIYEGWDYPDSEIPDVHSGFRIIRLSDDYPIPDKGTVPLEVGVVNEEYGGYKTRVFNHLGAVFYTEPSFWSEDDEDYQGFVLGTIYKNSKVEGENQWDWQKLPLIFFTGGDNTFDEDWVYSMSVGEYLYLFSATSVASYHVYSNRPEQAEGEEENEW